MATATSRVLAVDIGTSSVRAMVFDDTGAVSARAQIPYPTIRPAPYHEEQDPDLLRQEAYRAIARCLAEPGAEPAAIGAIVFSSQLYGVIALDAADRPLTRNILWSDGRAEAQAAALKAEHGVGWLTAETGCPVSAIFPLAKLIWLRETRPELFRAARRFVSIKDYVAAPLIGEWAIDSSMASATGLFDIARHRWHPTALAAAGIDEERLPRPVPGLAGFPLRAGSPLAGCGLADGVQVFLGGGDGPLANLGSGASAPGAINIDLGTSGAARCIGPAPTADEKARLWCFCLTEDLWVSGGIVTNVGNAYQWLAGNVLGATGIEEEDAFALLNRLAAEVGPGAGGLYLLPYLRKARAPHWDSRLTGTVYGLTPDHHAGHLARALLEAIAFDLRAITDAIGRQTPTLPRILLTGGLSKSPIIPQLLADVLERELHAPDNSEGSIAGAAILGLRGLGAIDGLAFRGTRPAGRTFRPDAAHRQAYLRAFKGYERLVEALRSVDLQEGDRP